MTHIAEKTSPGGTEARDRFVTFTEARETLGLSKSTIYRLLEQDALPRPIKIGKRTFFSARELQAWIAGKLADRGAGGGR